MPLPRRSDESVQPQICWRPSAPVYASSEEAGEARVGMPVPVDDGLLTGTLLALLVGDELIAEGLLGELVGTEGVWVEVTGGTVAVGEATGVEVAGGVDCEGVGVGVLVSLGVGSGEVGVEVGVGDEVGVWVGTAHVGASITL